MKKRKKENKKENCKDKTVWRQIEKAKGNVKKKEHEKNKIKKKRSFKHLRIKNKEEITDDRDHLLFGIK